MWDGLSNLMKEFLARRPPQDAAQAQYTRRRQRQNRKDGSADSFVDAFFAI